MTTSNTPGEPEQEASAGGYRKPDTDEAVLEPSALTAQQTPEPPLPPAQAADKAASKAATSQVETPSPMFADVLTLRSQVEALLFAAPNYLKAVDLQELLQEEGVSLGAINSAIESLLLFYQEKGGGFQLVHKKGCGYRFETVQAASYLMERLFSQRPRPLSRAAHETLAIIAYRQPVTRADIEFIRGVDAGSIIKNLLERQLILCTGRKEDSPGKPMVFGTTPEFLQAYQLKSLDDLPPLASFQPARDLMAEAHARIHAQPPADLETLISAAESDTIRPDPSNP